MLTRELPQSSLPEKLEPALIGELIAIIEGERLTPVFQPIVDFSTSSIIGYEGLIRGPASSRLYSPQDLFEVAGRCNMTQALERTCFAAVLERFVELDLKGSLSINLGPDTVQTESFHPDRLVPQLLK
ncbi:MAG: EAL domain-containing protein, partial [Aquaspirillum sp.]